MLKMFLDDREVNALELKAAFDALDAGPSDGGDYEIIALCDIDVSGNMYFEVEKHSAF